MSARLIHTAVVGLSLGLLVACGGGGGGGSTGTLAVFLTDAPFPGSGCLERAEILIDGVSARSEGGWVVVPLRDEQTQVTMDLLELRNGISAELAAGSIPTGLYDEIRLHVLEAKLYFVQPEPGAPEFQTFKIPSGSSSGLKVKIDPPIAIAAGQTTGITLDVDVAQSFHTTGVGGNPTCEELQRGEAGAIFSPVVRAIGENTHGVVTGLVTDDLGDPLPDVPVVAVPLGEDPETTLSTVFSTLSSAGGVEISPLGTYALALEPGHYDLYLQPQGAETYQPAAIDVSVVLGEITVRDLTLTAP